MGRQAFSETWIQFGIHNLNREILKSETVGLSNENVCYNQTTRKWKVYVEVLSATC